MTELDLRNSPYNMGLAISSEHINYQLYLLGCIINSSSTIDILGEHSLKYLRRDYQETEIGRILLTIAIVIRNDIDQNQRRAEESLSDIETTVGTLQEKLANNQTVDLEFREACNKIIHCSSINFDYTSKPPRKGSTLSQQVYLYGYKGNNEWKATIDINKFINVSAQLS